MVPIAVIVLTTAYFFTGVIARPCTFYEGAHQVMFGVRNGVVHFRLTLRAVPYMASGWTGVGFGRGMIDGMDVIIVRVQNGRVNVTDEYVRGYTTSFPDQINNVILHSSRVDNGILSVTFSRPVNAMEYIYDGSLLGCKPWKFVTGLNRMGSNGELYHHLTTPVHRTICIDECRL